MSVKQVTISKTSVSRAVVNLVRGDNRTQIIRLVVDRYEGGVDLANLAWAVYAVNADGASDVYYLPEPAVTDSQITLDWLVRGVATAVAGDTRFELEGVAADDNSIVWQGGTRVIKVYDDLNAMPAVDEDELTAVQELIAYVGAELPTVLQARDAANAAAERAETVATDVNAAETARAQAETTRIDAEEARQIAEQERVTAETARITAENQRIEAETARSEVEAARASAEEARVLAEDARKSAEMSRAQEEVLRDNAEKARATAETVRASAEQTRANAEAARAAAEAERANAEAARAVAEESRVAAETARATVWQTLQGDVDLAVEAAQSATADANAATTAAAAKISELATYSDRVEQLEQDVTDVADALERHIDAQYAAILDDSNTTNVFRLFWAATEGAGTKYDRLARWFGRVMSCDATFTVQMYAEDVSGDPTCTPLDDLAALGAAPVATDTSVPDADWSVEHRMTWYIRANALQQLDGTLDVLFVEGEDGFDPTGEIAPVQTLSIALYRKMWSDDSYWYKSWRCKPADGYEIMPEGKRPDGSIRAFVWHPAYSGALTADGRLTSGTGRKGANFMAAQNGINNARSMGPYEGLWTDCDTIWALDQFQLRHHNKENGGIMEGCCRWNLQHQVMLPEINTTRVLVTTAQIANFHSGGAVCVGDPGENTNYDRGMAYMRNIVDDALVLSTETVVIDGVSYGAINLDLSEPITTTATTRISTMPWHTGATDAVPGHHDGSPVSNTNGHFPFRLAGVEFMAGAYDVGLDPLYQTSLPEDGKVRYHLYSCPDSTKQANAYTNYDDTGLEFEYPTGTWLYVREFYEDGAVLIPSKAGNASETTHYKSAFSPSSGASRLCPWRFCSLYDFGLAGLAGEYGNHGPGHVNWRGWPRLGGSGARRAGSGVNPAP